MTNRHIKTEMESFKARPCNKGYEDTNARVGAPAA